MTTANFPNYRRSFALHPGECSRITRVQLGIEFDVIETIDTHRVVFKPARMIAKLTLSLFAVLAARCEVTVQGQRTIQTQYDRTPTVYVEIFNDDCTGSCSGEQRGDGAAALAQKKPAG